MPIDRAPLFPQSDQPARYRIHVCRGANCSLRNSRKTLECFEETVNQSGLSAEVEILATSCRDRCEWGPSVNIFPGPTQYANVDCDAARAIVDEHICHDRPVRQFMFDRTKDGRKR